MERLCKLFDHRYGRVALPPLDIADIGAVDPRPVGVVLLTPALRLAQAPYVPTEANLYLHGNLKTRLSPIYLQTISDIRR